jgi:adenylyltransferase/sulfurtransferase
LPTCSVVGVHPSVTSIISSLEVSETVRIIVDSKPKLAGNLLFFDLSSLELDLINLKRREDCGVCGKNRAEIQDSREEIMIEEVCSRGGRRTFVVLPKEDQTLDLHSVRRRLEQEIGVPLKETRLSLSFHLKDGTQVRLLESGICIIEGLFESDRALMEYGRIMNGLE